VSNDGVRRINLELSVTRSYASNLPHVQDRVPLVMTRIVERRSAKPLVLVSISQNPALI
jgi:hypothetical protein